jgi:hypothetical protein
MCPKCGDVLRLYVSEAGIQLLACMGCPFDLADRDYGKEVVLNKVRHMASRDHREQKKHVIKQRDR